MPEATNREYPLTRSFRDFHKSLWKMTKRKFARVLETFETHNETIINYFEERLTNASAESFNAR